MEDQLPKYEPSNLKTFGFKAKTEHENQPISKLFFFLCDLKRQTYIYKSLTGLSQSEFGMYFILFLKIMNLILKL